MRFGVDMTGVPCVGDSLRDLAGRRGGRRAADAGADRQGREDAARRQLSEEHGDLPGSRVRRVGAARGRLNRRARARCRPLRSLLFLLFQMVVTPLYAAVMLALFWLPRVPMYRIAAHWCRDQSLGRALDLRHPPPRDRRREHPAAGAPHIVMSKHSSTWETLALTLFFPPLAYVAKKELLSIPFFGWGFALASPITIDRKAGTDAMQQIATQGRERFAQGFWIVVYPEGTRIRAGTRAKYKTGGARLARRARRADRAGRAQRRLAVAEGHLRQAARDRDDLVRHADRAARARIAQTLIARSRDLDRERGRAPRRPGVTRLRAPRSAPRRPPRRRATVPRRRRASCAASRSAAKRSTTASSARKRRSIGMQIGARRPHGARAALGDAARDRGDAARARARGSLRSARRMAGAAPRRPARANGRPARRSSTRAASSRSPSIRRAQKEIAADLLNLTVLHPAPQDERQRRDLRRSAGCATRRCASSRRASPTCAARIDARRRRR